MRHPGGTAVSNRQGYETAICDTFNCAHCGVTVPLRAGVDPTADGSILVKQPHWKSDGMGVCLMCSDGFMRGLLCPPCHERQNREGGCRNFERQIDLIEKKQLSVATLYR